MNQRINYIISLYEKLKPEEEITRTTKINNATIEGICTYDGPAYHRVKNWLESKIGEKIKEKNKQKMNVEEDMNRAGREFRNCFELMKSRNLKYGDSWRHLRINSLVDLIMMKLDRCQKQDLENKAIEVELEDIINYSIFGLIMLRNKEFEKNLNKKND